MLSADLFHRAILTLELILLGSGLYWLFHSSLRYDFLTRQLMADLGTNDLDGYVLVYFSNPASIVCNTAQQPAIETLNNILGSSLQVLEIDVTKQPELAHRWRVSSVPTTFLINPRGELRHVNHGLAPAEELLFQLYAG